MQCEIAAECRHRHRQQRLWQRQHWVNLDISLAAGQTKPKQRRLTAGGNLSQTDKLTVTDCGSLSHWGNQGRHREGGGGGHVNKMPMIKARRGASSVEQETSTSEADWKRHTKRKTATGKQGAAKGWEGHACCSRLGPTQFTIMICKFAGKIFI